MKIAKIFISALMVLCGLEAVLMPVLILYITVDSTVILTLQNQHTWLKILFGLDRFLLIIFAIVFFMIPVIDKGVNQKNTATKIKGLLTVLILPFLDSCIEALRHGFNSGYSFFGKAAVTWFVANTIAFWISMFSFVYGKKTKSQTTIYLLVFTPLLISVGYMAYQNLFAYNWLTDSTSYTIWHTSLLVNAVFMSKAYKERLVKGNI